MTVRTFVNSILIISYFSLRSHTKIQTHTYASLSMQTTPCRKGRIVHWSSGWNCCRSFDGSVSGGSYCGDRGGDCVRRTSSFREGDTDSRFVHLLYVVL